VRRLANWALAAALVVVGAICAWYLSLAWYGFDLLDEGYFLTHARRIQLGGLPYRDFDTPYTPGIFYLYAWLLDWVGSSMVALRTPAVLGRGLTFLLLYVVGRRWMPPFFAALAPLVIVLIDRAPPYWSIHPGWLATPATIAVVLAVARYRDSGRARWLFWAGVATGIAFGLKQNLAVFVLMAALWLLAVYERWLPPVTTRRAPHRWPAAPLRVIGTWTALAALPLAGLYLVRPYLSPLVAALFVAPLAALSLLAVWHARARVSTGEADAPGRELSFCARPALVLLGFGAVTLPWLIALLRALNARWELLRGFVGQIDPSGYYYGMEPPQWEHWRLVALAVALPAALALMWGGAGWALTRSWRVRAAALLAAGAAIWWATTSPAVAAALDALLEAVQRAWWEYREYWPHATDDLVLYLPPLAFWVGLASLAVRRRPDVGRVWLLAAGACLLLTQYPRMGYGHIVWSGGALYVVGADRLHALHRAVTRLMPSLSQEAWWAPVRLLPVAQRLTVAASLVLLPAAGVLPYVLQRSEWIAVVRAPREEGPPRAGDDHLIPLPLPELRQAPRTRTALAADEEGLVPTTPTLAPPLLEQRVWAIADEARPIMGVVEVLRLHSDPGEPIFVYPAIPGIYYLADRPNATRFNHLFAGMASPDDQAEMVRQLERVRWVVWDDESVYNWVKPEDNAPVVAYIREHFGMSRQIGPYAVLQRGNPGEPRPKAPVRGA
jgi:hypothetical protein